MLKGKYEGTESVTRHSKYSPNKKNDENEPEFNEEEALT